MGNVITKARELVSAHCLGMTISKWSYGTCVGQKLGNYVCLKAWELLYASCCRELFYASCCWESRSDHFVGNLLIMILLLIVVCFIWLGIVL